MESINHSDLEKADMSKRPKAKNPESNQDKDKRKIRFRFVRAEKVEKHVKMSEEEEMFKTFYEEATFKVYGTIPAEKSSFKTQWRALKESHENGQLEKRIDKTMYLLQNQFIVVSNVKINTFKLLRPRPHYAGWIIKRRGFICMVRPTVHTNPSRKQGFSKTLSKLKKFKTILYMGFRAALNFRKFKVALNLMYRICLNFAKLHLILLIKIHKKKFHRAVFEI